MDILAKQIAERLDKKSSCIVFENHISRSFPNPGNEDRAREDAIRKFAAEHGWSVKIIDPGLRLVFKKV